MINFEAEMFKLEFGTIGRTFSCYQSTENPRFVTMNKSITTGDIVHAILWPSIGKFKMIREQGFSACSSCGLELLWAKRL